MNETDNTIPTSIFKHTTLNNGTHIVYQDKISSLLQDKTFDAEKLKEKLEGDQFDYGLKPLLVVSPSKIRTYYTPAQKKAIIKYRETHRDAYNEQMRNIYERKRQDENWLKSRNEKAKDANKKYRDKKKLSAPQKEQKPRGRPKKAKEVI